MAEPPDIAPELAFQSLYRRFRPQRFDEVRGQQHVTLALRNAVHAGRVSHAYLFSGPRGTGKTSTARILAKALNCTSPVDGEPCGVCDSCIAITAGASFDVHELDAASNNGVDAMRDLVSRASLASPGRSKVYIVDEVHMLSAAASNALLKTLEEPPEHVVFVLATTDPQKVFPTIRSRTQHFEFHLLDEEVLDSLLADVAKDAGLDLPSGALDLARRRAKGSARDALSVLDQVAAAGVVDDDIDAISAIARAIGESETGAALAAVAAAAHAGRDAHQIAIDLVERLRVGFLGLFAPGTPGADGPDAEAAVVEARLIGLARCVRAMELVGEAIVTMREAPEPRITLEVALIRLTHPEAEDSPQAILDRLERIERKMAQLPSGGSAPAASRPAAPEPRTVAPPPGPPARKSTPTAEAAAAPLDTEATAEGNGATPSANTEPPAAPAPARRPALGAFAKGAAAPSNERSADSPATPAAASEGSPDDATAEETPAKEESAAPSRDELVAAWGDHVLIGLRPKVKVIYMGGRFIESDGNVACFALPNAAHVSRAEPLRSEVTEALTRHFGRPVGLRLSIEAGRAGDTGEVGASPTALGSDQTEPGPFDDPVEEVAERTRDAGSSHSEEDPNLGLTWAKDRLLEAFPGAEEVEGG